MRAKRLGTESFCPYLFAFLSDGWILFVIRRDSEAEAIDIWVGRFYPRKGCLFPDDPHQIAADSPVFWVQSRNSGSEQDTYVLT